MQKKTYKAAVLFSGGQDSTTCLYWAKKYLGEAIAISFKYGQKHSIEIEQAAKIAKIAKVKHVIFDVTGLLGGSSLTDSTIDHNSAHDKNSNLPASFTAGRNALFLTIAGAYCYSNGIDSIVTGVCQTDYSGYPDCRADFIQSQENTLRLALDSDNLTIHAPLMWLTKAETWRMAKELGILELVINETITDYNGCLDMNDWGRGNLDNPASNLRANGYFEAKKNGWI